jgi:hypothetical protein
MLSVMSPNHVSAIGNAAGLLAPLAKSVLITIEPGLPTFFNQLSSRNHNRNQYDSTEDVFDWIDPSPPWLARRIIQRPENRPGDETSDDFALRKFHYAPILSSTPRLGHPVVLTNTADYAT